MEKYSGIENEQNPNEELVELLEEAEDGDSEAGLGNLRNFLNRYPKIKKTLMAALATMALHNASTGETQAATTPASLDNQEINAIHTANNQLHYDAVYSGTKEGYIDLESTESLGHSGDDLFPPPPKGFYAYGTTDVADVFAKDETNFYPGLEKAIQRDIETKLASLQKSDPEAFDRMIQRGGIFIGVSSDMRYKGSDSDTDYGEHMENYDLDKARNYNLPLSQARAERMKIIVQGINLERKAAGLPTIKAKVFIPENGYTGELNDYPKGKEGDPERESKFNEQRYAKFVIQIPEAPEPPYDEKLSYVMDVSPSMENEVRSYLEDWAQAAQDKAAKKPDGKYTVRINIQPFAEGVTEPKLGNAFTNNPSIPAIQKLGPQTADDLKENLRRKNIREDYPVITIDLTENTTANQQTIEDAIGTFKRLSTNARGNETIIFAIEDKLEQGEINVEAGTDEPIQDANPLALQHIIDDYPQANVSIGVNMQRRIEIRDNATEEYQALSTVEQVTPSELLHIIKNSEAYQNETNPDETFYVVLPLESDDGKSWSWHVQVALEASSDKKAAAVKKELQTKKLTLNDRNAYGISDSGVVE